MKRMNICVATGSRADYGLLYWLMKDIQDDADCQLQLLVTGMHLAPEFGSTLEAIEADGFPVAAQVDMLLASNTAVGVAKSMGLGVVGGADALSRLAPDWLVLLGDRFEMLAMAQVALVLKIPIAHIAGGDVTVGAFDEAIRHCITKMAVLHFVTNDVAARRVRQLGEQPDRIFNVGSPGLDYVKRMALFSRDKLAAELNIPFLQRNFLVTFHPATLDAEPPEVQFEELLAALDTFDASQTCIIFTRPNADTGGRRLIDRLDQYSKGRDNTRVFASLGQQRYLSLVAQVDVVIGNSSSGLYEVPSFKIPTVNVGDRQSGRLKAASVVDSPAERAAIRAAIDRALAIDCRDVVNPYGSGEASPRMLAILKSHHDPRSLTKKRFCDLGVA